MPDHESGNRGALFGGVFARGGTDTSDAAWLQAMLDAEAGLARALERAGLSTEPDPESLQAAEALSGAATTPWNDLMATFELFTAQFCALYRRIGELDPSERETSELLVAHELALRDFARAEIAGDTATSLDPINALAHMH